MAGNTIKYITRKKPEIPPNRLIFHLSCSVLIGKLAARFTRALHNAGKIFGPNRTGVSFR